jgi:exodeoxyribonuclease VII large subunit
MTTQMDQALLDPISVTGDNLAPYTVSELSRALKRTVEGEYGLVRVRGELLRVKRHTSGHIYLCLKDDDAVLEGVVWRGGASRLGMMPEDGVEVICTGRLTTYAAKSSYQIVIESMELAGQGALLKMIEERRKKLAAEGLFDADRKRPLPTLPEVIGIVTSPTGAVIRDILHRLEDRFPRDVLVWPVPVQGAAAAGEVAAAIEGFNALPLTGWPRRPDVLIVARGGGAIEDLMAFNEEIVVRAAAASAIPLISAVGHETDTTLIDFASDKRAPTPTAAAEFAVPVRLQLLARVGEAASRLVFQIERGLELKRAPLQAFARGLGNPMHAIEAHVQRVDGLTERLDGARRNTLTRRVQELATAAAKLRHPQQQIDDLRRQLEAEGRALDIGFRRHVATAADTLKRLADLLESYSYRGVLKRGFALVSGVDGQSIAFAAALRPGQAIAIELQDGKVAATIGGTPTNATISATPTKTPPRAAPLKPGQGNLF